MRGEELGETDREDSGVAGPAEEGKPSSGRIEKSNTNHGESLVFILSAMYYPNSELWELILFLYSLNQI